MRNDATTKIVITMRNVDQASRMVKALEMFFAASDVGGDCHLMFSDGYTKPKDMGFIGHDVRKAEIVHILHAVPSQTPWYLRDKYGYPIEFVAGRGKGYRYMRIFFQNLRKIVG